MKFLLCVTGNLLFAVAVIVIAVVISQNTNWFQPVIHLTCEIHETTDEERPSHDVVTLVISKYTGTAWWDDLWPRRIADVDFGHDQVRVTWSSESAGRSDATFVIGRKTGFLIYEFGENEGTGHCWSSPKI